MWLVLGLNPICYCLCRDINNHQRPVASSRLQVTFGEPIYTYTVAHNIHAYLNMNLFIDAEKQTHEG